MKVLEKHRLLSTDAVPTSASSICFLEFARSDPNP